MSKLIKGEQVKDLFTDGQTVMVGGFLEVGSPDRLIELLLESGAEDITLITNDTGFAEGTVGSLISQERVKKAICCHIGTNEDSGKQYNSGELEVELIPQGTLIERIRAAGAGLGGVLTPVGVGTEAAAGRRLIEVEGEEYILAKPLSADIALVKGCKADEKGNLIHRKAARNYNPIVATAGNTVVAEAEEIVSVGEIDPDDVMTPGIFVDHLLQN